jgi:hypothetical protein
MWRSWQVLVDAASNAAEKMYNRFRRATIRDNVDEA